MKIFKRRFWYSVPSIHPIHPIKPIHPTRKLSATRLVFKLRWTPKGECSGLVETSAAIIKATFFLGCRSLVFTTPLTQKYVFWMFSQMKFSSGKNFHIKKLEYLGVELATYYLRSHVLQIMLYEPIESSFGAFVQLSNTRFHLAPGHDFEKNHVKMVIL